ncbi:DNA glycosylase, partial [Trichocladium antarcticum]
RPPRGTVSSLPIPRLSAPRFGLIQEELAATPFRLLVAVTFLIRTTGRAAIPVFRQLMARFPTPAALAAAADDEVVRLIRPLGLAVVRCDKVKRYARGWMEAPPERARRYGVRGYPLGVAGGGSGVRVGEEFGGEDGGGGCGGGAWEIGHLTQGPYAIDSWRIFCRDVLLGRSECWTGKGKGAEPGFQPEWMRVLPRDKELRACLRWMWMREGWEWDPVTGEREPLREEMRRAVDEGRVGYDDHGGLVILDQAADLGTQA